MFKSLLIANRGEIAVRVMRTARDMGIRTIAVYSDADANALHVREADEAVHIGPAAAKESYLVIDKIIAAAKASGAEAIHPGYGFLSENVAFADACEKAGIIFVGPPASAIKAMGLKDAAKALMEKASVPVVPGYHGANQDGAFLAKEAGKIGYPVLIKAVAGGGGKGMRRVDAAADFANALASAQREAGSAFGDERVLVEKYVSRPRHIEIQVFADAHGNAVYLNERDCSLQRRHQKVIEEAPAPDMPEDMRRAMGEAAVAAAKAIGYRGAGTIEFIADASRGLRADAFWFMEMNTRLQVEHPVTEAITGTDLVEWQLLVAAGEPLPLTQAEIPLEGHAVEVRLYAEDPANNFFPSTGRLTRLRAAASDHIRTDMGVEEGDDVSMHYDPMIGKIIAHAPTRALALSQLRNFLLDMEVVGPKTNLSFLAAVLGHEAFGRADIDTGFIEKYLTELLPPQSPSAEVMGAALIGHVLLRARLSRAAQAKTSDPWSPWAATDEWVLGGHRSETFKFMCGDEAISVAATPNDNTVHFNFSGADHIVSGSLNDDGDIAAVVDGRRVTAALVSEARGFTIVCRGANYVFTIPDPLDVDVASDGDISALKAPMPGKVVAVLAVAGDAVKRGTPLVVMEAMKMEQTLAAPADLVIASVNVAAGDQIEAGAALVVFEQKAET
ncbi:MAG: acetyl/propionyl/methylcrotonyl-CoA carboxylase subunit alpha [Parvibaculaceae bacterium]